MHIQVLSGFISEIFNISGQHWLLPSPSSGFTLDAMLASNTNENCFRNSIFVPSLFGGISRTKKVPNFFFLLILVGYHDIYIYIYIYIYEPCDQKKLWIYRMYFNS